MNTKQDYIAVLDSGLGGLSVLRHLRRRMPGERFVYYGDSAHAPYGTRSHAEVEALTMNAAAHLMSYGLKALVVACNTATAAAIIPLRAAYPNLIVVGVEPALKLAADRYPGGSIGVMATPVTLREEKFNRLLQRCASACQVYKIPAPQLVPLIEEGLVDTPIMEQTLHQLLDPYMGRINALVLGCTHYPLLEEVIGAYMGPEVRLINSGSAGRRRRNGAGNPAPPGKSQPAGTRNRRGHCGKQPWHRGNFNALPADAGTDGLRRSRNGK